MLPHFASGGIHRFPQLPGGHSQHAAAEGTQLHQRVRGCHPYRIVAADLIRQGFNVGLGVRQAWT